MNTSQPLPKATGSQNADSLGSFAAPQPAAAKASTVRSGIIGQCSVIITFHDGEVLTEKNVDEVHDGEETLFLTRNGIPGTSFDQCDIKKIEIVKAEDDIFDPLTA